MFKYGVFASLVLKYLSYYLCLITVLSPYGTRIASLERIRSPSTTRRSPPNK